MVTVITGGVNSSAEVWELTFTYTALGLADRFQEYYNAFLNRLATSGVGVVSKSYTPREAKIKVKTTEEEAEIRLAPRGADIEVKFNVKKLAERRTLEKIETGISVLQRVLSGDILGATFEAAEESIESALSGLSGHLASVIANAARDTAEELRQKVAAVSREEEEARELLEEVKGRLITLREEAKIAKEEGKDVSGVERRCDSVERLMREAEDSMKKGDYITAKAKLEAARRLLERAESLLSQVF